MKSIRRGLTIRLLVGLFFLWLGGGLCVYLSVRQSLLKSIDAQLAVDARKVRFVSRSEEELLSEGVRRIIGRAPDYHTTDGDAFYQMWDIQGEVTEKSESLGDFIIPFPGDISGGESSFRSVKLDDGRKFRMMIYRSAVGGKGKGRRGPRLTVLGRSTYGVRQTLSSVAGGIAFVGLLGAIVAIGMVRAILNRGLAPLDHLGKQAAEMSIDSGESSFDDIDSPDELRPVYERLNELMDRVHQSFDRERQFSSDLAHEMRTPVAELKAMTELALKWPEEGGEKIHRESLDIANQLESMSETLLLLSRVESGQISLNSESVVLSSFVSERWRSFSDIAEEKGVSFESVIEDEIYWDTDPELLSHIISNLLSNAVEYTEMGDWIRVDADLSVLSISNPTSDLKPGDTKIMFDRLWRADSSRTASTHSGLGLSLARKCAEALGFQLFAELNEGVLTMKLKNLA